MRPLPTNLLLFLAIVAMCVGSYLNKVRHERTENALTLRIAELEVKNENDRKNALEWNESVKGDFDRHLAMLEKIAAQQVRMAQLHADATQNVAKLHADLREISDRLTVHLADQPMQRMKLQPGIPGMDITIPVYSRAMTAVEIEREAAERLADAKRKAKK
jgi:hypothetical protein